MGGGGHNRGSHIECICGWFPNNRIFFHTKHPQSTPTVMFSVVSTKCVARATRASCIDISFVGKT